jgi:hypothetical protein
METGQKVCAVTANQMEDVPTVWVAFHAHPSNAGNVVVGGTSVQASGQGLTLAAGEWSPWFAVNRLNKFYYVAATADDLLEYVYLR